MSYFNDNSDEDEYFNESFISKKSKSNSNSKRYKTSKNKDKEKRTKGSTWVLWCLGIVLFIFFLLGLIGLLSIPNVFWTFSSGVITNKKNFPIVINQTLQVRDNATFCDSVLFKGDVTIKEGLEICGNVTIKGNLTVIDHVFIGQTTTTINTQQIVIEDSSNPTLTITEGSGGQKNKFQIIQLTPARTLIEHFSESSTDALICLDAIVDDGQSATFEFFRNTDTSGIKRIRYLRGTGANAASSQIGVDGEDVFFVADGQGGKVGIAQQTPTEQLHIGNNIGDPKIRIDGAGINDVTLSGTVLSFSQNSIIQTGTGKSLLIRSQPGTSSAASFIRLEGQDIFMRPQDIFSVQSENSIAFRTTSTALNGDIRIDAEDDAVIFAKNSVFISSGITGLGNLALTAESNSDIVMNADDVIISVSRVTSNGLWRINKGFDASTSNVMLQYDVFNDDSICFGCNNGSRANVSIGTFDHQATLTVLNSLSSGTPTFDQSLSPEITIGKSARWNLRSSFYDKEALGNITFASNAGGLYNLVAKITGDFRGLSGGEGPFFDFGAQKLNQLGGGLSFYTAPQQSNLDAQDKQSILLKRMTIDEEGKVGIGIDDPSELLHIVGGVIKIGASTIISDTSITNSGTFTVSGFDLRLIGSDDVSIEATDDISIETAGTLRQFISSSGDIFMGTNSLSQLPLFPSGLGFGPSPWILEVYSSGNFPFIPSFSFCAGPPFCLASPPVSVEFASGKSGQGVAIRGDLMVTNFVVDVLGSLLHISDERVKEDIEEIPLNEAINTIKNVAKGVRKYNYKEFVTEVLHNIKGKTQGFVAQELSKNGAESMVYIKSEAALFQNGTKEIENFLGVDYTRPIPSMILVLEHLLSKVKDLKTRLTSCNC